MFYHVIMFFFIQLHVTYNAIIVIDNINQLGDIFCTFVKYIFSCERSVVCLANFNGL